MTTLFISDLHLDESNPVIVGIFNQFIDYLLHKKIDALYILGDLFEAWIGDDEQTTLQKNVCRRLAQLASAGTPVYFIHGNRDFLIGKRFVHESGCILLPEHKVINLYNRPTLIMHGDSLCTDDIKFQKFRKLTQNKLLRQLFLFMPLSLRKKVAINLRNRSKKYTAMADDTIMDVNQKAVNDIMKKYHVDLLIHGHTHRPFIHKNENNTTRIVLGAWHTSGNVLICKSDHTIVMKNFTELLLT